MTAVADEYLRARDALVAVRDYPEGQALVFGLAEALGDLKAFGAMITLTRDAEQLIEQKAVASAPRQLRLEPEHVVFAVEPGPALTARLDALGASWEVKEVWTAELHPRDPHGRFAHTAHVFGALGYAPDPTAPEEGEWEYGPDPADPTRQIATRWRQAHAVLLADALRSWKGDPAAMSLHIQDALGGLPPPASGSGKKKRAQVEALLWELEHGARPNPGPLYRGANIPPSSWAPWTEDRRTAERRAGGGVVTLPPGVGRGFRVDEYLHPGVDIGLREWIVLPPDIAAYVKALEKAVDWIEAEHPRGPHGRFRSKLAVGYAAAAQMAADAFASKAQRELDAALPQLSGFLATAKAGDELNLGTVSAYVSKWDTGKLRVSVTSRILDHPDNIGTGAYVDDPDAARVIAQSAQDLTDTYKATTLATQRKQLRGVIPADKGVDGKRAYKAVRNALAENDSLPLFAALRDRFPEVADNVLLIGEKGYGRTNLGIRDVFVTASRRPDINLTAVNAVAMTVQQRLTDEMPGFLTGEYGPHSIKPGGDFTSERDPAATLRHEWGHGLWEVLSDGQRSEFIAMLPNWDGIAAGLSKYAAGTPETRRSYEGNNYATRGYYTETFAEAVALASSPYYKPDEWPDWVRQVTQWIDDLRPQ